MGPRRRIRGRIAGRGEVWLSLAVLCFLLVPPAGAQFTSQEIAERPRWEQFLRESEIVGMVQLSFEEGVTEPWKLTLKRDGVVRFALWKNPTGVRGGYLEGWRYEIAAYVLDKLFGIHMVPPTVEKILDSLPGSCQLWIEDTRLYRDLLKEGTNLNPFRTERWKEAGYLSQFFDNLIGNEDRHTGNVLVTPDFRAILIDHSRTFRTTEGFVTRLPFSEENVPPQDLMRKLPRAVVEKLSALTERAVREAVGDLLTDEEIRAVMARKTLLVDLIQRIVARFGIKSVLY